MHRRTFKSTRNITQRRVWDILRPFNWHPLAAIEQSLHEMNKLEHSMPHLSSFPLSWSMGKLDNDEKEFFKDLPKDFEAKEMHQAQPFVNYSCVSAHVIDKNGKRIESVRRRYEDSTGRLKAIHERNIEGKKMVSSWDRLNYEDKGSHETNCSQGTMEDFEKEWEETPFGEAVKPIELGEPSTKSS